MSDSKQKSSHEHGSDLARLRSYGHFFTELWAFFTELWAFLFLIKFIFVCLAQSKKHSLTSTLITVLQTVWIQNKNLVFRISFPFSESDILSPSRRRHSRLNAIFIYLFDKFNRPIRSQLLSPCYYRYVVISVAFLYLSLQLEDHNDGAVNAKLQIGKAKTPIFVASREDIHCYIISIRMMDGFCYLKHSRHSNERATESQHLQYHFIYPVPGRRSILETEKANIKILLTLRVCFYLFIFIIILQLGRPQEP